MGNPRFRLYDEESLAKLAALQRKHAWDLEEEIDWGRGIDLQKPLVALDGDALLFPGASAEQRLAISQMMGLVIAAAIFEMEECLIRLRRESWESLRDRMPVGPEFSELGELFFEEELKHSTAFKRYTENYAHALGVDLKELLGVLPALENTRTEKLIKVDLKTRGQTFWWIVANVEQEFLRIYHSLRPFKDRLDPLYFEIHQRHFEEEARHAPFPYLVLELLAERSPQPFRFIHSRADVAAAQVLQTLWTLASLRRLKGVKKFEGVHPFFDTLVSAIPILEAMPAPQVVWKLLTTTPYVSSLVNLNSHPKVCEEAQARGAVVLPFPEFEGKPLVRY
jgi:hypothetical protein